MHPAHHQQDRPGSSGRLAAGDRLRQAGCGLALAAGALLSLATVLEPDPGHLEPLNDAGAACQERRWFADTDRDGHGDPAVSSTACTIPLGWVAFGDDNCPDAYNPDQIDSDGDGAGDACDVAVRSCDDLSEGGSAYALLGVADDGAATVVSELAADAAVYGERAVRVVTQSGSSAGLRIALVGSALFDASPFTHLLLAVWGHNSNTPAWQEPGPTLVLEDAAGRRRRLAPARQQLGEEGAGWQRLRVPLAGSAAWRASGDSVDMARLRAVEIRADTWGAGFVLDLDGVAFGGADTSCAYRCPATCNGRGECDLASLSCRCDLGAHGVLCQDCASGFSLVGDHCQLDRDGDFGSWPNPVSQANSDPWLAVHHDKLRLLRPQVLVLNYANDSTPEGAVQLVDSVLAGFREASRGQGGAGTPQLEYSLARPIVDLRDGVDGRSKPPWGWPYLNSTQYPRTTGGNPGERLFDYAALFTEAYAARYGFADPAQAGRSLPLCELIDRGLVHEVWVISAGDSNDAAMAEVLESKPVYDAVGNRIVGSFDRCAGNGCFGDAVPQCQRMVRIGSINYHRGAGCYLHSQSHGVESTGARLVVPQLSEWFVPFARFDLDRRYGLAVSNLYQLGCNDRDSNGEIEPPCLEYPAPGTAVLHHGTGNLITVQDWDPACGNVHFAPNATWHYETDNPNAVLSSCDDFGRGHGPLGSDALSAVSATSWSQLDPLAPDCGGGFLIWWYQHMPGYVSNQTFVDGRPMLSVWPFLFY